MGLVEVVASGVVEDMAQVTEGSFRECITDCTDVRCCRVPFKAVATQHLPDPQQSNALR